MDQAEHKNFESSQPPDLEPVVKEEAEEDNQDGESSQPAYVQPAVQTLAGTSTQVEGSSQPPVVKAKTRGPMVKVVEAKNTGPIDKYFKRVVRSKSQIEGSSQPQPVVKVKTEEPKIKDVKEADSNIGESRQPPDVKPIVKADESHAIHSFQWCVEKYKKNQCCNEAGTIENSLRKSEIFRKNAQKNKDKQRVLQMNGRAISSQAPCSLFKKDSLIIVKYLKDVDKEESKSTNPHPVDPQREGKSAELVNFHVQTKGGKGVVKIMRNPEIEAEFQEITVYAYKGEKVKQALMRDGRLQNRVFTMSCALLEKIHETITEMCDLVDDLDDKTFKIILLDKSDLPKDEPGSLGDATQRESQRSDKDPPQQSTTTLPANDNTSEGLDSDLEQKQVIVQIPTLQKMQHYLSSQFDDLVQKMKSQPGFKGTSTKDLFRVDYGKNKRTCREVKTMRKLMDRSDSVCQVRIDGRPEGSGFLLFDKFVLTNGHVLKNTYCPDTWKLYKEVTVHFSFESLEQEEKKQELVAEVREVACIEHMTDESGNRYDWALLKLGDHQTLPDPLITCFGLLPEGGGICIIGHPNSHVKMIDPCFIVPTNDRDQVVSRHLYKYPEKTVECIDNNNQCIQLLTERFFETVAGAIKQNPQILTYETCFYFGSSGSPVFDENCYVVAMHSGGYVYGHGTAEKSVIEYGYPLSTIIERIIVQAVERNRSDVLDTFCVCDPACKHFIIKNAITLVESRNPNKPEVINNENVKKLFELLHEQMDTN